ncbi:MAG TPA: small ribosomal subunit biogenesis GTPase RsgA, partial [Gammaproteobacteria bacterium]|nr:small ribosomal subunit biogenesis GTPase RsgA [Gammaproteobacteria bacterium]
MSKRKISRKQAWRANKIQQERIDRANKKHSRHNTIESEQSLGHEERGRVVAGFGSQLIVEDINHKPIACSSRQNLGSIIVGDQVIWQRIDDSHGVVSAILPRDSLLERPNFHGNTKPVAANIQQIVVMCSPVPAMQTALIDRYLVAIELASITPIIVVNKIDLLSNQAITKLKKTLEPYVEIGYQVLYASCHSRNGLKSLNAQLEKQLSILVGQSGVGKSSTIKALLPDIDIQIGELSQISKLGKHTTSASRLYHLPLGGAIIDSPGVRDFGLWHMEKQSIAEGFIEFKPYLGTCKFSNCSHTNEPGCAVMAALKQHKIARSRWKNYTNIYHSLN